MFMHIYVYVKMYMHMLHYNMYDNRTNNREWKHCLFACGYGELAGGLEPIRNGIIFWMSNVWVVLPGVQNRFMYSWICTSICISMSISISISIFTDLCLYLCQPLTSMSMSMANLFLFIHIYNLYLYEQARENPPTPLE